MASRTDVEAGAREWFAGPAPTAVAVRDERGRSHEVAGSDRLREIERRARLIAVSAGLARAVAALVADRAVRVHQVRVDPRAAGDEQVMALRVTLVGGAEADVPVWPGVPRLHAYPAGDRVEIAGEPLVVVELPGAAREADGWVPAAAFAEALRDHVAEATAATPSPVVAAMA
ncbi:hypothetical protein [Saccharothrix lopnurensis]|uniref:Uncharacterized protein n=1 Tax=Saccharothrix lopnurensis TaxID=1670621 RepID=A0ABW1PH59_9PSEU